MATAGRGDKVAFLKDLLGRNPEANHEAAARSWQEAGHDDTISGTTFYRVKSDLGLSGRGRSGGGDGEKSAARKAKKVSPKGKRAGRLTNRGDRPGRNAAQEERPRARDNGGDAVGPTAQGGEAGGVGDRERLLDQAEAHIDDILFLLKSQGGMPEAEARLREVRRMLVRGQGG